MERIVYDCVLSDIFPKLEINKMWELLNLQFLIVVEI